MLVRSSGVLLHLTSLPSGYGTGDMGPWAYTFADRLSTTGQGYWQILPLGPTSPALGNSPYSAFSAFAGNPLLISPDILVEHGFLDRTDIPHFHEDDPSVCRYEWTETYRFTLLRSAYAKNKHALTHMPEYERFCEENAVWLEDFALFMTLKDHYGGAVWNTWEPGHRDRDNRSMAGWRSHKADEIEFICFVQFLFFSQWRALKRHCNAKGVRMVGDMPIYVTFDSADVWARPELYKLDAEKRPLYVAGVPPDYFSETGQLWGNPVYNWERMEANGFAWWTERMRQNLELFDAIRLDHFRGFAAYWEIPAGKKTAINGEWIEVPGAKLFAALSRRLPGLPIIAEDLGFITADVRELKDMFHFPGMKVLMFGFGGALSENPDSLHNHTANAVVYTGTHDNNTTEGWWVEEASQDEKNNFRRYIGHHPAPGQAHRDMIRLAMSSTANTAIFPMQDILGLGAQARMNTPSVANGNWSWRATPEQLQPEKLEWFADMARFFGRV